MMYPTTPLGKRKAVIENGVRSFLFSAATINRQKTLLHPLNKSLKILIFRR